MTGLVAKFITTCNENKHNVALRDRTTSVSWVDYFKNVERVAASLKRLKASAVGIIGFNSFEWFYSAMGALYSGVSFTGIYTTNGADAIRYVVEKSGSQVLVVDDLSSEVIAMLSAIETSITVVVYGKLPKIAIPNERVTVLDWQSFLALGAETIVSPQYGGDDTLCSLIYTSGTTGNPKGVRLTQRNLVSAIKKAMDGCDLGNERIVSYLPLSHVAAQVIDLFSHFYHKGSVYFAQPDALKGSLVETLRECRPTVFFGVPRVWEKMEERMVAVASDRYKGVAGGVLYLVSLLGKTTTSMWYAGGTETSLTLANSLLNTPIHLVHQFYSNYVFSAVKSQLGLDKCRYFLTGAAPIKKSTLAYFASIDIPIMELYGMSETSGIISLQTPADFAFGSCGKPVCDVRFGDDGEILVRGANVFDGYHNDEPATRESMIDGWLRTGDLGKLENGRIYITGRKKELLITAGGENVAPVPIEDHMMRLVPQIETCVVVGDREKYLSLLVTLGAHATVSEEQIQRGIDTYNESHSVSNAQKIQKFHVLPSAFSVEGGELTPTLKVKRKVILSKYEDEIAAMYGR